MLDIRACLLLQNGSFNTKKKTENRCGSTSRHFAIFFNNNLKKKAIFNIFHQAVQKPNMCAHETCSPFPNTHINRKQFSICQKRNAEASHSPPFPIWFNKTNLDTSWRTWSQSHIHGVKPQVENYLVILCHFHWVRSTTKCAERHHTLAVINCYYIYAYSESRVKPPCLLFFSCGDVSVKPTLTFIKGLAAIRHVWRPRNTISWSEFSNGEPHLVTSIAPPFYGNKFCITHSLPGKTHSLRSLRLFT